MRKLMIAAAAVSALFATQAAAATDTAQEVRKVSFRGVNFNDQTQVDSFYARLKATAREVCSSEVSYDKRSAQRGGACVAEIMNQAVTGMQRPMLTARHQVAGDNTRYATGF